MAQKHGTVLGVCFHAAEALTSDHGLVASDLTVLRERARVEVCEASLTTVYTSVIVVD